MFVFRFCGWHHRAGDNPQEDLQRSGGAGQQEAGQPLEETRQHSSVKHTHTVHINTTKGFTFKWSAVVPCDNDLTAKQMFVVMTVIYNSIETGHRDRPPDFVNATKQPKLSFLELWTVKTSTSGCEKICRKCWWPVKQNHNVHLYQMICNILIGKSTLQYLNSILQWSHTFKLLIMWVVAILVTIVEIVSERADYI